MTDVFEAGSLVEIRGQQWLLTRTQRFDACTLLSLEGRERDNAMERIRVIAPFDRPRRISTRSPQPRRRDVVLKHALAAIHCTTPPCGLWTAAAARMDLHAYQLEPAMAVVAGATRLLLADAVGLGKTIQAGLIASELLQRGWIERALIVCPAGLRETWRSELHDRFGITAAVLDQQAIADRVASLPRGINPWTTESIAIASIDFVKRAEVLAALDGVPFDVLIADEAHHLSPGSDRGAAIARLAARAVWCVFVSATPHSGDRQAFDYLTAMGRHADPIVIFRRNRRDVGLDHVRREHFLEVKPNHYERALFDAIERYSSAIWSSRGRIDHAARLVAITIARRAASSSAAIRRTLQRRLDLIGVAPASQAQPSLPWQDEDDADGGGGDDVLAAQGLDNVDDERALLQALIDLATRRRAESKVVRLQRILSRINEPVIVFTEFRDTLEAIVDVLRASHRVAAIHGAMTLEQRHRDVRAFNDGAFDVLVSTDAAGEGLNLHHRCRVVIDVELPWNPLRLEQRVGRVDRLGQRRTVHAIRMLHSGTIEQAVLDRLSLRRGRADTDLARAVNDMTVGAAVFEHGAMVADAVVPLETATISGSQSELIRAQQHRRWIDCRRDRCLWAKPRQRSARRMIVIHRTSLINPHGVVAGDRIDAHAIVLGRAPRSIRDWRSALHAATTSIRLQPVHLSHVLSDRVAIRIAAIRRHLAREQRREYQRSLFDGRADHDQIERERAASRINASLDRIERAIAPPGIDDSRVELVAAWRERRT